jgi:molecular chaperone DnaK
MIPCEPNSITIIQGMKIANATLPYHVGVELYDTTSSQQGVYAIKGLEKNKSLPAKGKGSYTTAKDIRPANRNDQFVLQFYGFEHGNEGSRAIFNDPLGGMTITGEQLPALLPAGSAVELTLSLDASRRASLSIYIPLLDETIEARWDSASIEAEDIGVLRQDIEQARALAEQLSDDADVFRHIQDIDELERLLSQRTDFDTKIQVRDMLKTVFIALDRMQAANQWPKREVELNNALEHLVTTHERYGDSRSQQMVTDYHKRVRQAKVQQEMASSKQLLDELFAFSFALVQQDIGLWISFIKEYDQDFDTTDWVDRREARLVLNEAKVMIAVDPSKEQAENAVRKLWSLMPKGQSDAAQRVNTNLLRQ